MAKVTSNKDALFRALGTLGDTFNLRKRLSGGKRRLGDELIDTAAAAIEDRTVNRQQDPTGQPLPRLRPATIARKRRLGLDTRILIETHEMLDPEQIKGKTFVDNNVAIMQAGLDAETQMKVEAAEEGGGGRPKRPFFDLGKDGEAATDVLFQETIDRAVGDAERA